MPCSDFVEWRVIYIPEYVSRDHLFQMKDLIFHNFDKECQRTSVHHEGILAQKIQTLGGRDVHMCTYKDYIGED